jgi:hypothetical protein
MCEVLGSIPSNPKNSLNLGSYNEVCNSEEIQDQFHLFLFMFYSVGDQTQVLSCARKHFALSYIPSSQTEISERISNLQKTK